MRALVTANLGLVIAGVVSFVLMGAGSSMYGPALPVIGRTYGVGTGELGLLVTAHWIGSALGVALTYGLGNRVLPRHCLGAVILGAGLIAAGPGFAATAVAVVIFGAGHGIATVIYNRRMLAIFGALGPSMLAFLNALFGAGAIAGPLVFVALGQDVRLAYGALAVLGVVAFAASFRVGAMAQAAAAGRYAPHLPILAFGAVAIGIEASLIGLGPLALIARGAGETVAAGLLSGFFVAFLVGRTALVGFAHRIPPFTLYAGAMAGALGCGGVLAAGGPVWLFVPLGGFAGLFFPGFYVAGSALMGDDPRTGPTLIAAGLVGGIAMPFVLARVMGVWGDAVLFPVLAALMAAAALAALALLPGVNRALARG